MACGKMGMGMAALLTVGSGCGGTSAGEDTAGAGQGGEALPDYSVAGEWTPSTLESSLTGTSGVGLVVQVWYPSAEPGSGETIRYDDIFDGAAYENLPAACDAPRPVLVFSHGNGGVRWQTASFMEHLASHGYIVAAPEHTYNTAFDLDYDRLEEVALRRPQDIADTFDWLVAQSDDLNSGMAGCVDAAAGYAVSGHSFGGYTTYATAGATVNDPMTGDPLSLGDARVWAALALSPWDAGGSITDGTQDITVPVMTLSGALDDTTPWSMVSRLHGALTTTPRYLGKLATAGHYSFAPVSCLYLSGDGCGEDYLDLETVSVLLNTAGLAFLEESRGLTAAIEQLPPADDELTWEIVSAR